MAAEKTLNLPVNLVSRVDVGRLIRELDSLDGFLESAAIREPGTQAKLPRTSRLLDETLQLNKLNALVEEDRRTLRKALEWLKEKGPHLHMSFSSDPSPLFLQKLMTWLRQEIHPYVMVQIGLQPNLGAGCIVRTPNKYFDFSLRQRFLEKRQLLISQLQSSEATKEQK
jgi:hypothetical protein